MLNRKAIEYMQSIFSIKDDIGKKEAREISALCGITVTQLRDYISSQRSIVRKLVNLSREKATMSEVSTATRDGCSLSPDETVLISKEVSNPVAVSAVQGGQHNPIKTDLNTVEGGPSSSQKEETIPGVDYDDKEFLENIFNLMRKEHTFSGQVKLMEWVLQIHNTAVLSWFSTKGGITILATWLSQAALEEQTTVLLVLFKVLCHLPLHTALPVQMSAILETVNGLQFYRTSDISNMAEIFLSRWSKMFGSSQAPRNTSSKNLPKNPQEIIRKDRIGDILGDGSWPSKMDLPDGILAPSGSIDDSRKEEPKRTMKLLESADGSTKKHGPNVSSAKIKERSQVRPVEYVDIPLEQTDDLETPAAAAASDDADAGPPPSSPRDNIRAAAADDSTASTSAAAAAPPPAATTGRDLVELDIELLAALLKNPDIVYALTSGQGKNLTTNKKVALLNLVKTTGVGLAGIVNEFASVTEEVQVPVPVPDPKSEPEPEPEPEPTSLPSPTPPASATQVGWRCTQLQSQYSITTDPNLASHALPPPPPPPPTIPMDAIHPGANHTAFDHHQAQSLLVPPRVPTTIPPPPLLTVPANPWPPQQHQLPAPNLHPTMMTTMTTMASSYGHAPLWQTPNPPEIILPPGHYQWNHHPSPMPSIPPPPMKPQSRALPQTMSYPPKAPTWPPSAGAAFAGGQNPVPVSRTGYPNNFINGPVVYPANSNNTNNSYNSGMEAWGARSWQSSDVRYDRNFQQAESWREGYSCHDINNRWQNRDRDRNGRQ